jgi:hypothetical protein
MVGHHLPLSLSHGIRRKIAAMNDPLCWGLGSQTFFFLFALNLIGHLGRVFFENHERLVEMVQYFDQIPAKTRTRRRLPVREEICSPYSHSQLLINYRILFFIGGYRESSPARSRCARIGSVAPSVAFTKSKLYQSRSTLRIAATQNKMIPKC